MKNTITAQNGNQFKYGYDYEADEDYITKIVKEITNEQYSIL